LAVEIAVVENKMKWFETFNQNWKLFSRPLKAVP